MNDETLTRTALLESSSDAATRVFTTILTRSPISRIDVARLTGLSQAAVTKAVVALGVKVNADELIGVATDLTTRSIASLRVPLTSHEPVAVIDAIVDLCGSLQATIGHLGPRLAS